MTNDDFRALGFRSVRTLPNGKVAGLFRLIYTTGLCVGLSKEGYERRYCYADGADAIAALLAWDGEGDAPGPWIKRKGAGGEAHGPGAKKPVAR